MNKKQRSPLSIGLIIEVDTTNSRIMTGFGIVSVGYFLLTKNGEAYDE
jgi:hypothetical protein